MTLKSGTRLGPYEILSLIGTGGMGEVYRAKDPRLGRDVAIKVLPGSFSEDTDRLRRFELEARAAGLLNHPNITAVYDIGQHEGAPYVVQELLEGETLRAALAGGRLTARKAIDFALQIARGMAQAHEKGIVHRDLKPENLFITRDGRVKILDFGLAKLTHQDPGVLATNLPTAEAGTEAGVVMGTIGYMSPEQVKGKVADARSDIFSFGAILYEMLAGRRAFHGDSAAETISAILREEPPDLSASNQSITPGLERIVRHCLEKNPEQRFHSAHDLAFDLESLSGSGSAVSELRAASAPSHGKRLHPSRLVWPALLLTAAVAAFLAGRGLKGGASGIAPSYRPISFHQETIFNARFALDGRTVIYSAAAKGNTPELFTVSPDFPAPKPLGLSGVHLLAVSRRGELAVLTGARFMGHNVFQGTLARMQLQGGAPREILENVREADWSPDGESLAIIREAGGKDRLEFPAGTVLCETGGYLSDVRFSPKGDRIAFFEHPSKWDDRGGVSVVDLKGKKTVLADGFWGEEGIAWSPKGDEVLFSAAAATPQYTIYAATVAGKRRAALDNAGGLTIRDVSLDGHWLVTREIFTQGMPVRSADPTAEQDLAWLDGSDVPILSPDGKTVLFTEFGGSTGSNYLVCLRRTDGSPVVQLGEGFVLDLSPDGKWALAGIPTSPQQLILYPTGAGTSRRLDRGGMESYATGHFFPDGRSALLCGHEAGKASRCYVQDLEGGKPRPITPEGTSQGLLSPDGSEIVVSVSGAGLALVPVKGGEVRPIPGTASADIVIRWDQDGRSILVCRGRDVPLKIDRVTIASGNRVEFRTLAPPDLSGVSSIPNPYFTPDQKSYAYNFVRTLSRLFIVEGAR
ncbi:MAG: protein kinase [Thermoanaerobaculia bacterium]